MFDQRRFKAQMILKGETGKSLAEKMGIDESTLYRKIKADGAFTRQEINQLIVILEIDNPVDIFFAPEIA